MRIKSVGWVAAAGVGFALSGCGSSSGPVNAGAPPAGGSTASTASRAVSAAQARYIARGDQVCREGNAAIAPVNARGVEIERRHRGTPDELALLVPVLREGLRDYRVFFTRLERIPRPPQDTAALAAIFTGLKQVGSDLDRLNGALARGETAQVRTIAGERETDHAKVSALELEYGFDVCGQPPSQPSPAG
jgi:hypothetical protein